MSILAIDRYFVGNPNIVGIVTDNTLAAITTAGYLTGAAIAADIELLQNGSFEWTDTDIVLIKYDVGIAFFVYDATNATFVANPPAGGLSSTLSNGFVFVGNASNVATGVAMSGDATIVASGALTIANNAITTAKILNANVTLAKLAAGIAPAGVIKFMGQATTVGGAAAEAITVTGAVAATDRAFVQVVDNGTNNVTVLQAVVTTNTLTITFSADPGADCIVNYQLIRVAS